MVGRSSTALHYGLASLEQGTPFTNGGRTIVPIVNENLTDGRSQGIEAMATITPTVVTY